MIRVIHVDDDFEDLELTRLQLKRLDSEIDIVGFTSASIVTEMENLEIQYDCILSDYQMPELDGLEFLKILRERDNSLPFVFLTGQGNEELAAEALRTGANDYYTKDVGFAHYQRMINSIRNLVQARREILQSKKIERKFKSIEKEKETILGNMQEMVIYYNTDHQVIWANQSAIESQNTFPDEIKGKKCCEVWHPDSNDCQKCPLDLALRTGEIQEGERNIPDGRTLWIRGIPIKKDDGEIIGVFESTLDITNRKKAQQELRENEQFLESMFNSLSEAIITTDVNGNINRMNPVAEFLTGWSFKEAKGSPLHNVFKVLDSATMEMIHKPLEEIISKRNEDKNENQKILKSKTGIEYVISHNGDIVKDSNGNSQGVVVVFRDQTEESKVKEALKKNEKKFKSLFNQMHDGLAIHEFECDVLGAPTNYRLTDVNHTFEKFFNLERDQCVGKMATDVYETEKAPYLDIYSTVESTGSPAVFESYYTKLQKHLRIGAFSHEPGKFVTVVSDIDKEKSIDNELKNRVYDLAKRIKELNCLYKMLQLFTDPGRELDSLIEDVAQLIPSAFQHPQALSVLIVIDGKKITTKGGLNSNWRMRADIKPFGKKRGFVEIYYCGDRPEIDEDPFFNEEKYLLETIAHQLSIFLERVEFNETVLNSKTDGLELRESHMG